MKQKKERQFKTLDEEVAFLRRQVAGLKGQNTLLVQQKEDLNKCVGALKDEIARNEKVISGLESQVKEITESLSISQKRAKELQDELAPMKANVEYYNDLPWIVKMFTFHIP